MNIALSWRLSSPKNAEGKGLELRLELALELELGLKLLADELVVVTVRNIEDEIEDGTATGVRWSTTCKHHMLQVC